MNGWFGIDLDGTLAEYHGWAGATNIGLPVPKMVERVKQMLSEGKDVRIFTARVWPIGTLEAQRPENTGRMNEAIAAYMAIQTWCILHIGKELPITCIKDYGMVSLVDDRAKQCCPNTGVLLEEEVERLKKALRNRCVSDSRGYFDYDVAEWFDPK